MRANVAVATVQGKAYFLIVNELQKRKIPFVSLIPGEPIRTEIRAVITSEKEKHLIAHHKIIVYNIETDPEILGIDVVRVLRGKEIYETVFVGVDPGEVFGLAVVADGAIIDTENCFSSKEISNKIKKVLRSIDVTKSNVTVKIGNGVPIYKELIETLDKAMPIQVALEIVSEAGTNRYSRDTKNRRGLRHMVSAIRIAGRTGRIYPRRETIEQNS
jgi:hypothetical protein